MGLVAAPAERLMEDEWMQVKARSAQQGESTQPCAICREEFRLQPQVFLHHSQPPLIFCERALSSFFLFKVFFSTCVSTYTHKHTNIHTKLPYLQFLYVLICVDNCTNLPILPWNSSVTWWCSNQCVTVRVIQSFTPFRSPFKMPISSRMWN